MTQPCSRSDRTHRIYLPPRVPKRRSSVIRFLGAFVAVTAMLAISDLSGRNTASATIPPFTVEDLSRLSTDVVVGEVVDSRAEWSEWPYGGTVILTTLTFQVESSWKGSLSGAIDVVLPGGQVGDDKIVASCVPHLEVNDRAVLFLKEDLQGLPRYWVFGLERGTFDLVDGDTEVRQQGHGGDAVMTLAELQDRVLRTTQPDNQK